MIDPKGSDIKVALDILIHGLSADAELLSDAKIQSKISIAQKMYNAIENNLDKKVNILQFARLMRDCINDLSSSKNIKAQETLGDIIAELMAPTENNVLIDHVLESLSQANKPQACIELLNMLMNIQLLESLGTDNIAILQSLMQNKIGFNVQDIISNFDLESIRLILNEPHLSAYISDSELETLFWDQNGEVQSLSAIVETLKSELKSVAPPPPASQGILQFSAPTAPKVGPQVDVAVIMGSDSDLPTMSAACKALEELGVSFEVKFVSAHRTASWLTTYASSAQSRGIKVIIAGAGGAAHLPGMVAGQTPLPVVGVPCVPPTAAYLGGMDALLSIAQMPAGVPVGTMAIGNATNAGLYAARILAVSNPELLNRIIQKQAEMADKVMKNNDKLEQSGWKDYAKPVLHG